MNRTWNRLAAPAGAQVTELLDLQPINEIDKPAISIHHVSVECIVHI